ncbi:MAG: hypothetical protein FD164_932 [Nitrospirae bacterium]|nr:MAG: hypothetical protein FD164_932 [Nitrospirota bacterium]
MQIEQIEKRIKMLEAKKKALASRKRAILAAGNRAERKKQTRAKIIIGGALIAAVRNGYVLPGMLQLTPSDFAFVLSVLGTQTLAKIAEVSE